MSQMQRALCYAAGAGYVVNDKGEVTGPRGHPLKLRPISGYLGFSVKFEGDSVSVMVHRLVAYQKFGPKRLFTDGIQVRHRNGNCSDNRKSNIFIGTPSQNEMDKKPAVRFRVARKARRKLTDDQVRSLRKARRRGATYKQLCEEYGLAKSTISYIVNLKTCHVEE